MGQAATKSGKPIGNENNEDSSQAQIISKKTTDEIPKNKIQVPELRFEPPPYIQHIALSENANQILLSLGTMIVPEILMRLDLVSLLNFACCSKKWNEICSDDFIWGKIYAQRGWGLLPKLAKANPTLSINALLTQNRLLRFGRDLHFKEIVMERLRGELFTHLCNPHWMVTPPSAFREKNTPILQLIPIFDGLEEFFDRYGIMPAYLVASNSQRNLIDILQNHRMSYPDNECLRFIADYCRRRQKTITSQQ